jgi:hypothetical protein
VVKLGGADPSRGLDILDAGEAIVVRAKTRDG